MKRKASFVIAASLAVVIRLLWSLDANPLLLIYDSYLTFSAKSVVDGDTTRRIFGINATTSLEGKTVWITGSSSGIGAELAVQLASAGVGHLILSGRRIDSLNKVAKTCRESQMMRADALGKEQNIDISLVPFDLGRVEQLDEAVTKALEAAPETGIDIIILNAGQYHCAPALETNVDEALPDLMQVNFASPVQLAHKLLHRDRWKERRYGHIVAVSSLMGRGASPLNAAYSASKHALRGYFLALAAEESSWLRVDVVLPGATDTVTELHTAQGKVEMLQQEVLSLVSNQFSMLVIIALIYAFVLFVSVVHQLVEDLSCMRLLQKRTDLFLEHVLPVFNSMTYFVVEPGVSFHSVQEVLSLYAIKD